MKFCRFVFCIVFLSCITSVSYGCGAGEVDWGGGCYACAKGCYCTHAVYQWAGMISGCNNAEGKVSYHLGQVHDNGWCGAYACPQAFPQSNLRSTSIDNCYAEETVGNNVVKRLFYSAPITCSKGYYLPKASEIDETFTEGDLTVRLYKTPTCKLCKGDSNVGEHSYCPGGTYTPSLSEPQGISSCRFAISNTDRTQCGLQCSAGKYAVFPSNWVYISVKVECDKDCPKGFYCPSGFVPLPGTVNAVEINKNVCQKGTYSDTLGLGACKQCTGATEYINIEGSTGPCMTCSVDDGKIVTKDNKGMHIGCEQCESGKFATIRDGVGVCQQCPTGYKCTGGKKYKCDGNKNEYQDIEGQSSCNTCVVSDEKYITLGYGKGTDLFSQGSSKLEYRNDGEAPIKCDACNGAERYYEGKFCKSCLGLANSNSGKTFFDDKDNNGKNSCRYIDNTKSNCRYQTSENKFEGTGAIYVYQSGDYVVDTKNTYSKIDFYVDITDGDICRKCDDNMTSSGLNSGKTQCFNGNVDGMCRDDNDEYHLCSAGYKCPLKNDMAQKCNSEFTKNGVYGVEICEIGTFSYEGKAECTSCAPGYTTINNASGTYCSTGNTGCTTPSACQLKSVYMCIGDKAVTRTSRIITILNPEICSQWPACITQGKVNSSGLKEMKDKKGRDTSPVINGNLPDTSF